MGRNQTLSQRPRHILQLHAYYLLTNMSFSINKELLVPIFTAYKDQILTD